MLLPLADTNKEFEKYALSPEGSQKIRNVYKIGGLAEDKKLENTKGRSLFKTAVENLDYFEDLERETQKASGTFRDSVQYKNFRTMVENYASLAREINESWDDCSANKEKFDMPKIKSRIWFLDQILDYFLWMYYIVQKLGNAEFQPSLSS